MGLTVKASGTPSSSSARQIPRQKQRKTTRFYALVAAGDGYVSSYISLSTALRNF